MKKLSLFLFLLNIIYANNICESPQIKNIKQCLNEQINTQELAINYYFNNQKINLQQYEWQSYIHKKCNWIKRQIDIKLYGQEDQLSYLLCIVTEQKSRLNERIYLQHFRPDLVVKNENNILIKYDEILIKEHAITNTGNLYLDLLFNQFSKKYCDFYEKIERNNCLIRLSNNQFFPENYSIKIEKNRSYLFNEPTFLTQTKMYLIKGDQVKLLQRQNDFYEIEYESAKKGTIKKWLHCEAIDAC